MNKLSCNLESNGSGFFGKKSNTKKFFLSALALVGLAFSGAAFCQDIFKLVEKNDFNGVETFLNGKTDEQKREIVNQVYENTKVTTLNWACAKNNSDMVRLFLPYCTPETINKPDEYDETPLYASFKENDGSLEMVELLLKYGANIDDKAMNLAKKMKQHYSNTWWQKIPKEIYEIMELTKQFDASNDKKYFFNSFEQDRIKDEGGQPIKYSAKIDSMLRERMKNTKQVQKEKTLFDKVPGKKKLLDTKIKL